MLFIHTGVQKGRLTRLNLTYAQDVAKNILLCSTSSYQMFGAKLSGCQIVQCRIVLVPNCPDARLSGAKLSWCQIFSIEMKNHNNIIKRRKGHFHNSTIKQITSISKQPVLLATGHLDNSCGHL